MPRFKELDKHVKQAVAGILRERLGQKAQVLAWLKENDADRENGTWLSVCIAVPQIKDPSVIFDTGEIER